MKNIYKYVVFPNVVQSVRGKPLVVGWQFTEMLTIWCEVDESENPPTYTDLAVVPTGGTVPEDSTYLGSAISDYLVFHVYMKNDPNWVREMSQV